MMEREREREGRREMGEKERARVAAALFFLLFFFSAVTIP